jgi:hypothetical protein
MKNFLQRKQEGINPAPAKTQILLLTAMHERPLISELFAIAATRLKKENDSKYDVTIVSLVSDPESRLVCERYGIEIVKTVKRPLGRKWNQGIATVLERYTFDYMMQMGDDDIMSSSLLDLYAPAIAARLPYFGMKKLYFLDALSNMATRFTYKHETNKLVGCGRMFLRSALEATGYHTGIIPRKSCQYIGVKLEKSVPVYLPTYQAKYLDAMHYADIHAGQRFSLFADGLMRGLDNHSEMSMVMNNYFPAVIETEKPLITDVKSRVNIWRFDQFSHLGESCKPSAAMAHWGDDEKEYYTKLCETLKKKI